MGRFSHTVKNLCYYAFPFLLLIVFLCFDIMLTLPCHKVSVLQFLFLVSQQVNASVSDMRVEQCAYRIGMDIREIAPWITTMRRSKASTS